MTIGLDAPLIGFASGIGVSVIAAIFGTMLQVWRDRKKRREQAAFEVQMLLLELNGHYFWIASSELRNEKPPAEMAVKVKKLAWRIADKLRETDDIEGVDEILEVLMSESAFATANDRAVALDSLIRKLDNKVNPRYAKSIRLISEANVRALADQPPGHRNNAPGLLRP